MQLTRSVSYAVGILLNVERARAEGPLTANRIARRSHFPPRFLYRVLRRLVDAEIMTGVSGPGGGYALAKPPRKITLAAIVEAVEGPITAGVLEPAAAYQKPAIARINALCEKNAVAFRKALAGATLEQLAKAGAKQKPTKKSKRSVRRKSRRASK